MVLAVAVRADDRRQVDRLFELLELAPGMTVADVGAGSGPLTVLMAQRIGPEGRLYSTDIDQNRLKEIRAAVAKNHLQNVEVVEGAERATNLPDECCDAIFIRDVYHHFTDPASMDQSLAAALKPGGRLAIIDFEPRSGSELPAGVPANRGGHGIRPELLESEVTAAGLSKAETISQWDGQKGLFLILFRKP